MWISINHFFWISFVILLVNPLFAQEKTEHPQSTNIHIVQEGETLYRIARQYDIPIESLMAANRIDSATYIASGRHLVVPNRSWIFHAVVKGDTLYNLSTRYGVKLELLMRINQLDHKTSIAIDRTLKIPIDDASSDLPEIVFPPNRFSSGQSYPANELLLFQNDKPVAESVDPGDEAYHDTTTIETLKVPSRSDSSFSRHSVQQDGESILFQGTKHGTVCQAKIEEIKLTNLKESNTIVSLIKFHVSIRNQGIGSVYVSPKNASLIVEENRNLAPYIGDSNDPDYSWSYPKITHFNGLQILTGHVIFQRLKPDEQCQFEVVFLIGRPEIERTIRGRIDSLELYLLDKNSTSLKVKLQ